MLHEKDIRERLKDIDEFLLAEYKKSKEKKKRDWRTYEQRMSKRIKEAIKNLEPLVDEAVDTIKIHRGKGRKPELTLKQKVILLLLQRLVAKSNRNMAYMLDIFSLLSGIDVSYKTIERLYSDEEVEMALHNLHILILKKKGVKNIDTSGDGTGYSLTIRKHYALEIEKRKDKAKESQTYISETEKKNTKKQKKKEKLAFAYSFKLLDFDSKMYIARGISMKSEKEAFDRAYKMLGQVCDKIEINLDSVRLDKYYSYPSYVDKFGEAKVYIIPKKNATLRGSWKWKKTMKEFVENTLSYLEQYYLREHSEAEFSVDKKWFGWKVGQKREDRIDTALACTDLWHNLLNLYST